MIRLHNAFASTLLIATPALANDFEDFDRLDARISELAAASGEKAEAIDRRIKLARCPDAPTLEKGGVGMIAIRCVPLGWRLRVPTNAAVPVPGQRDIVQIAETRVVRKGEAVNVMVVGDDFSVSYVATAMDDGAVGSSVRVKFSTQSAFMTAKVTAPGKVQMDD
jgi:flagellar basal body P-ring formation protein FlgA